MYIEAVCLKIEILHFIKTIMVYLGGAPLAQRCLSDPGADSPTVFNEKAFREQCLGENTYAHEQEHYRMARALYIDIYISIYIIFDIYIYIDYIKTIYACLLLLTAFPFSGITTANHRFPF